MAGGVLRNRAKRAPTQKRDLNRGDFESGH